MSDAAGGPAGDPGNAVPGLVTLHVWTVSRRALFGSLTAMATGRPRLRAVDGLSFAKLLGTGSGTTFSPRDVTLDRWALLACWRGAPAEAAGAAAGFEAGDLVAGWDRRAQERWRAELVPLSSRGLWSGRRPFGQPAGQGGSAAGQGSAPVAAITRARLRVRTAARFWEAVPPVAADLAADPGLLWRIGVGEAPLGLQGTFSIWRSAAELTEFAYRRPAHRAVIAETARRGWYAEELFARFRVLGARGTVGGVDPLAARA